MKGHDNGSVCIYCGLIIVRSALDAVKLWPEGFYSDRNEAAYVLL